MTGIKGLKDKAIKKLPKLATKIRRGFVAMDITWGTAGTPSELDIVSTLTCLINDLDPNKDMLKAETGLLFAEYINSDGIHRIDFGMSVSDYVMKV